MEYSEPIPEIVKPDSRLYAGISKSAPIDQGTGATFAALTDRKLIEIQWREHNVHGAAQALYLADGICTTAGS